MNSVTAATSSTINHHQQIKYASNISVTTEPSNGCVSTVEIVKCNICSTTRIPLFKCTNCRQVYYCSVAHQRTDWAAHKLQCHPFHVAHNERFGRHLISARAIKAGEIVLREKPLVKGPAQITSPVCVGCLHGLNVDQLTGPSAVQCTRCGWPLCSVRCQEAPAHQNECELTVARGSRVALQHYFVPHPTYHCVTVLRCLLLQPANKNNVVKEDLVVTNQSTPKNSDKWQQLQKLESHCDRRRGGIQWHSDREGVARFIPRFFKCPERWTEEEILRCAGIVQINGHEVPLTEPPHVAIYNLASLVEHSCMPNLSKSFTSAGEVLLWAVDEIAEGKHLSICYSDVLWGTANRQNHLQQTKMFGCECERCSDVTELGTGYSAVCCRDLKCAKSGGLLLPASLHKWEEDNWQCGVCKANVEWSYVAGVLERAGRDLEAMDKDIEDNCIK